MQFYKIFKQVLPFILLFTISTSGFAQKPAIIEFGWDYPTVNILSQRLDSMQHTPFDGICFSLQKNLLTCWIQQRTQPGILNTLNLNLLNGGNIKTTISYSGHKEKEVPVGLMTAPGLAG
ncbi:MAG: hypothetical protein IPP72_19450 [Chitinophagaceae bacterium]|nr:hypothetical protein [Chitinophagaceae bacterium]